MSFYLWGAKGYIGSGLYDPSRHVPVYHCDDLSLPSQKIPDDCEGIIWAAGWPGNKNVDDVERNPMRSALQNVWEPLELAHRCQNAGKRLLVLCSGCIYDGLNEFGLPHKESDTPNFVKTVYLWDQAKRSAILMRDYADIATIFRIRVPFDSRHHPRNTLHKLAQMPAVWDKDQSYTWLPDLARAVKAWETGEINAGAWHVTQPGTMNNFDAVEGFLNGSVKRISGGDRPGAFMACPRSSAILDSSKLASIVPMASVYKAWAIACSEYKHDHIQL